MTQEEVIQDLCSRYHAGQDYKEICWIWEAGRKIDPKVVVEIGVYGGGNLKILSTMVTDPNGLVVGLDYDWSHWAKSDWTFQTDPAICRVELLDGDSHKKETLDKLIKLLDGRPIDFLFIDGDHSGWGCKMDYEMFSPLVRSGGIIGFHDLNDGGSPDQNKNGEFNVKGFWKDLNHPKKYDYYSPLHDSTGYGIGYIIKE